MSALLNMNVVSLDLFRLYLKMLFHILVTLQLMIPTVTAVYNLYDYILKLMCICRVK